VSWPSDGKPRFIYRTVTGFPIGTVGAVGSRPPSKTHMIMDRAYCHRLVFESTRPSIVGLLLDLLNEPDTEWRGLDLCARLRARGTRAQTARMWITRYRKRAGTL
jgi:hypothetical protein